MRTTLNIHDETLKRAAELTGVKEKTTLVRLGLEALIARESGARVKSCNPAPDSSDQGSHEGGSVG